jgi:hypothetical protein
MIGNDDVEAQCDLTDDERITRAIALYAFRRLRILPAKLNFMSNPPVP